MSGGDISRKISDQFPADLPRVGMGNDLLNWGFCMAQGTHPRSRGENETCAPERCPPYGSSPLTRGKHIMRRGWPTCPGITPRWAGCHPHAYRATIPRRTHPRSRREHTSNAIGIVRSPDHPCSRGEHTPHVRKARPCSGSSLLTRGTHRLICANITQLRQIMEAQLNAYP